MQAPNLTPDQAAYLDERVPLMVEMAEAMAAVADRPLNDFVAYVDFVDGASDWVIPLDELDKAMVNPSLAAQAMARIMGTRSERLAVAVRVPDGEFETLHVALVG